MTIFIESLAEVFDAFDVAVLDQWGVLHNGSTPYPYAAETLQSLERQGKAIVVVSNSGKRADLNADRIRRIGLPLAAETIVVTSGEALWSDLQDGRLEIDGNVPHTFFVISATENDATVWADAAVELRFELTDEVDAILVMGIRDGTPPDGYDTQMSVALERGLPLVCSNPDKSSPRADGLVTSPGAIAERYQQMGGTVVWYGKPHASVYGPVLRAFPDVPGNRLMMVGDSLEHDIAGAAGMGFRSALIQGGIHESDFRDSDAKESILASLVKVHATANPDYCLPLFR